MLSKFVLVILLTINNSYLAYKLVDEEYFIPKCGNQLVLEGHFLVEQKNFGKEFWICVDYKSPIGPNATNWNPYPASECGGKPQDHKNLFWYAFHGTWDNAKRDKLELVFSFSAVYPFFAFERVMDPYIWNSNILRGYYFTPEIISKFRLVQSHGSAYDGKIKNSDFDYLDVDNGGIGIRSVADDSIIHIRVNGVGFQTENVYEEQVVYKSNAMETNSTDTQNLTTEICSKAL